MMRLLSLVVLLVGLSVSTGHTEPIFDSYGNSFDLGNQGDGVGFNKVYSSGATVNLGAVPGFSFLNEPENNEPVAIREATLGGGAGISSQGCASISFDDYLEASFNMDIDLDRLADTMKTTLAKQMLTKIFSHPALASAADALREVQNTELAAYQESCDLNEIMQDGQALCIKQVLRSNPEINTEAAAQKHCSSFTKDAVEAIKTNLGLEKAFNTVFSNAGDVLRTLTSMCKSDKDDKDADGSGACFITALLPRMQACHNYECTSFDNGPLVDMGKVIASVHPIAGKILNGPGDALQEVLRKITYAQAQLAALKVPSEMTEEATTSTLASNNIEYFTYDYQPTMFGEAKKTETPKANKAFLQFMGCNDKNLDPLITFKTYARILKRDYNVDMDVAGLEQKLKKDTQDFMKLVNIGPEPSDAAALARHKEVTGLDLPATKDMLEDALNCALNYHIHVSIDQHLRVQALLSNDVRENYYDTVAVEVAGFVGNMVLQFILSEIEAAEIELLHNKEDLQPYANNEADCDNAKLLSLAQVRQARENGTLQEKHKCEIGLSVADSVEKSIQSVKNTLQRQITAFSVKLNQRKRVTEINTRLEALMPRSVNR